MQMFRAVALVAAVVAGLAGPTGPRPATALPLTFTDTIASGTTCLSASAPVACNGGLASDASVIFTLDVTDAGFLGTDIVTGAQLTLTLFDDKGQGDGGEKIDLTLDLVGVLHNADANHDAVLALSDLALLVDGKLVVTLAASEGDFLFGGSTLTLWVDRPAPAGPPNVALDDVAVPGPPSLLALADVAVPGPPSLLALAAGLLVAAATAARRPR